MAHSKQEIEAALQKTASLLEETKTFLASANVRSEGVIQRQKIREQGPK